MYQQNIGPTQGGKVPKRIANRLQPMLQEKPRVQVYYNEDLTIDMLLHIAKELGLVKVSRSSAEGVKHGYEQGPLLEQWSQMGVVGQTHDLLEFWLKSLHWADVAGANFDGSSGYYLDIMAGRKAVLAHLSNFTPGRWYTIDSLLHKMTDQAPLMFPPTHARLALSRTPPPRT